MKKPYIKRYKKIFKFDVWIVDGNYIRTNIDIEFTNFDHHYCHSYIPKNQLWIDNSAVKGEEEYYIKHLLVEYKLMKNGLNYNDASDEANITEMLEREKHKEFKNMKSLPKKEAIKKIHKILLKEYSKKIKIWIVRGRLVRDLYYIDFTAGGHDKIYPFIPKNEVWIDDCIIPKERKFIILHEVYERKLMKEGKSYDNTIDVSDSAHRKANELESSYRKNPKNTIRRIKELIKQQ